MAPELRAIRSEAEYEVAMEQLAALWGAKGGTAAGQRLDMLATLVEAYEAKHYAMDPSDLVEAPNSARSSRHNPPQPD